jgi:hypothetical protein
MVSERSLTCDLGFAMAFVDMIIFNYFVVD